MVYIYALAMSECRMENIQTVVMLSNEEKLQAEGRQKKKEKKEEKNSGRRESVAFPCTQHEDENKNSTRQCDNNEHKLRSSQACAPGYAGKQPHTSFRKDRPRTGSNIGMTVDDAAKQTNKAQYQSVF